MIRALLPVAPLLLVAVVGSAAAQQPPPQNPSGQIQVTARDGIEWRQNEQVVIARGDARAVRNDVQVLADVLVAHYRKKAGAAVAQPAVAKPDSSPLASSDGGSSEIYRLEADGHVKIFNNSDIAVGDHAVYDIDQAVVVLTGKNLSLTTPNQVMTARDTLEYYAQKHMAVGRGLATVVTSDGRRLSADTLVAYTNPPNQGPPNQAPPNQGGAPRPAAVAAKPSGPLGGGGKLQRVEAFGHVEARTATETITGDRGVYVADTGMARLVGSVQVTRGQNHAVGDEALINMKTGVSTLIMHPGHRVEGLIVPSEGTVPGQGGKPAAKPAKR